MYVCILLKWCKIFQKRKCSCIIIGKEIGDEEPCYSTKILIFSFIWAGLAALHKASTL